MSTVRRGYRTFNLSLVLLLGVFAAGCRHAAPSIPSPRTMTTLPPTPEQSQDPFWIAISSDGGQSFRRTTRSDAMGHEYLSEIAITPAGVLYLMTTGGLLRSADAGKSFETLKHRSELGNPDFNDIEVDAAGILYLATNRGLWISKDQAQTFRKITTAGGLASDQVNGVYVAPGGRLYAATNDGVAISTDDGASFTNHGVGTAGSNENVVYQVHVDKGRTVYALAWFGLSIASGEGARFAPVSGCKANMRGVQADSSGRVYVAGGTGLCISTDGGKTFGARSLSRTSQPETVTDVYLAPSGTLFVATPNGIWISKDAGASFSRRTANDGLPSDQVERIVGDAAGNVYAVHRITPHSDLDD